MTIVVIFVPGARVVDHQTFKENSEKILYSLCFQKPWAGPIFLVRLRSQYGQCQLKVSCVNSQLLYFQAVSVGPICIVLVQLVCDTLSMSLGMLLVN